MRKKPRTRNAGGVGCSAWLGVLLCSVISNACETIQQTVLMPQASAAIQRLESIQVPGLNGGIGLAEKVALASAHPSTKSIHLHDPQMPFLPTINIRTLMENLALGIRQLRSLLVRDFLDMFVSADSKQMRNKPTESGKKQEPQGVTGHINHAAWLLLLTGGGYGFILMLRDSWKAISPNYNSTKDCFAYFGFSPGGAPDKTKACLLFYRSLQTGASRNCSIKSGS